MSPGDYLFDAEDRDSEQGRLQRQATLFDPVTERLLRAAGIEDGMRVLDLGSGAGDVTRLAARLVGRTGHVVGVERSGDAVAGAEARMRAAGVENVSFRQADVDALAPDPDDRFDAVIGRLILMYVPDPAATLAAAARLLAPGGLICMQEIDGSPLAAPETPGFAAVSELICTAFARTGASIEMGDRLHATFRAAGLPGPELRYERIAGGPERGLTDYCRDLLVALTPVIEAHGLASVAELELDSIVARLDAELERSGGIVTLWPMIGAWSRRS